MKKKGMDVADTSILYVSDEFVSKADGIMMPAVFKMQKVPVVGDPIGSRHRHSLSPQVRWMESQRLLLRWRAL